MSLVRNLTLASTLGIMSAGASADVLPVFPFVVPTNSLACANYGDFVSCSAQYLNFIATGNPNGTQAINFVVSSNEGALKDPIVIFTGSGANISNNGTGGDPADYSPGLPTAFPSIDDAYTPAGGAGSVNEYGTHFNTGADPSPTFPGDNVNGAIPSGTGTLVTGNTATAWDVSIPSLIAALTFPDGLHEMYIMFDNNQIGTDPGQNILGWALVCAQGTGLTDVCFELNGVPPPPPFPGPDPTTFNTAKTFGGVPSAADYVLVNGTICVDNTTFLPVAFNTGSCPAGSTLINNNLGTNETEFILQIPELDLLALLAAGYTNLAVQFRFTNNDDGFENIFLLAGPLVQQLPVPGSLALLGLGLIGLGVVTLRTRRRQRA